MTILWLFRTVCRLPVLTCKGNSSILDIAILSVTVRVCFSIMSSYYYKVVPPPRPPDLIGTKKVSQEELSDMVNRLSRPGSARSQLLPSNNVQTPTTQTLRPGKRAEFNLERFLRRIQRPTVSHQLSRQWSRQNLDSLVDQDSRPSTAPRPLRRTELDKLLANLSRPTTASRAKSAMECHLCDERDRELNKQLVPFDYPYAADKVVSAEEANVIVARVSSATQSSQRGAAEPCLRVPPDFDEVRALSRGLPLVSGLRRSKSVAEVVNRLYKRPNHRSSTQATAISGQNTT